MKQVSIERSDFKVLLYLIKNYSNIPPRASMHLLIRDTNWPITRRRRSSEIDAMKFCISCFTSAILQGRARWISSFIWPHRKNPAGWGLENVGAIWNQTCLKSISPEIDFPAIPLPFLMCALGLHPAWKLCGYWPPLSLLEKSPLTLLCTALLWQ